MGIADLFRPKHRHSDVRVRTEAVRALTTDDAATLIQVAKTDRDIGVRRLAMSKIDQADVLAELATAESERSLRDFAGERAAQLWLARACGEDADIAGGALTGIIKLGDQHALVEIVARASAPAIRKRAFGELRDPKALAELAKRDAPQELRTAAVARIDDGDVLRALAIDTTSKEVGLAAVEKLDDVDRLEHVAQKAKNKAVRQKARKIVGEIVEAERAKKPGVPDDVKRRHAERSQLLREVEGVADSFDFARGADIVRKAEAGWAALGAATGAADDGDERFTRAAERFWRRKELHESQSRSADELRAVEREAQASREAAARERELAAARAAEAAAAAVTAPAEPVEVDPVREAEAAAKRAERERLRAEDDARRAAQAAEREARAKEDAERAAAVAASLTAMNADLEQLASAESRDLRAIDRTLAQAAKAFDNIGKVPAAERDALADRYRTARGKLVTRAGELREAEDWQRWANVPKAEAMIETAKAMLAAPVTPDLGNRLRQLQALWKEVGPMPQRRSKELWEQFKALCDQLYDQVKGVRAVEHEKFADVAAAKEALIAEAEALADSTDLVGTADKLKALQAQWKQSGHLPRKQGDELWKRFRGACDRFFARRKPLLDAQHEGELANLAAKQDLVARAQAVSAAAGEGTWGQAIGEIKDLQRAWKEIGYVPRRDADAVYRNFRTACDALFAKRDAARDGEALAHRAELDAVRTEIAAVIAAPGHGGDGEDGAAIVARAVAVRTKAREHGGFATEIDAMVRHVLAQHAGAVAGSELDPAQLRARRDKLIARATELLPKQAAAPAGDLAAQLKQAMGRNAFGDLRFSGRDPVEVVDELRASWAEAGPILDDADRAQAAAFDDVMARVLAAAGASASARAPRAAATDADGGAGDDRGGRRRRRNESSPAAAPMEPLGVAAVPSAVPVVPPVTVVPDASASAVSAIATPDEITATGAPAMATHDAVTQPARLPPELAIASDLPAVVAEALPAPPIEPPTEPRRASGTTVPPPMDEVDGGWDLGDDDPTASPSASEMAGDGAVDGDSDVD